MSGGGGGVIIIHSFIETGLPTEEEKKKLLAIADRSPVKMTYKDAVAVCKIIHKYLRSP